jgi:hypothetical protein
MTEAEWLAGEAPVPMLEHLRGKASDRKLRLFACACVRHIWDLLATTQSGALGRHAIRVAERYADGLATPDELARAHGDSGWVPVPVARAASQPEAWQAAWDVLHLRLLDGPAHAALLRELFGNPFRPVSVPPAWREWNGRTIPKLAAALYAERRFAEMPVLADALEEAGCTDQALLDHCRRAGEHVRGCWVVDLLAGKG